MLVFTKMNRLCIKIKMFHGMYVLQLSPEFQPSIFEKLNNLRMVFNLFCKQVAIKKKQCFVGVFVSNSTKNNVLKL